MAVKWAVANGNWTSGSTWNDGTEPTQYDEVFLNGHIVTASNTSVISISNLENSTYNIVAGGHLTSSGSRIINANIFAKDETIIEWSFNGNGQFFNINGNIVLENCFLCKNTNTQSRDSCQINVVGNITTDTDIISLSVLTFAIVTITGNITASNNIYVVNKIGSITTITTFTINGITDRCTPSNNTITNMIISGESRRIPFKQICTNLEVNGTISYISNDNSVGFAYRTLVILNPDTFTWKDVTEPRSNPFIILTDAEMNNRQQYPPENEVKEGTEYVWGEKNGTYEAPPESVVLKGYVYDNGDKIGSLENQNIVGCVTKEDVREGVELIGLQEVGTLVVPDVDDVREGVVFDNGSVGTLIVEGGGDRLRIADFGYYTNAQSDTFIVDLTDDKKPIFAQAEERVLLQNCPDIDLNDIAEPYYDDLFVRFLKYAVIVEYYRTAGVNSIFTPSEPTAEVVNKANTICEVWQNSANIYLKAWQKKYPNLVKKHKIML